MSTTEQPSLFVLQTATLNLTNLHQFPTSATDVRRRPPLCRSGVAGSQASEPAACTALQAIHTCITISQQKEALSGDLQSPKALSGLLLYLALVVSKIIMIATYRNVFLVLDGTITAIPLPNCS